jgi:N-acetylglucosaminyl-diphospho-decaprenol L-rhamnosyltransferase
MNKFLTVVIPSYKSRNRIISHISKLSKKLNIIIIENSEDINLKKQISKKFRNTEVYLKRNIGYGRAINFAAKKVNTKYFFVMNPDTIIYNQTLKNLINAAEKIKLFGMMSPEHISKKRSNLIKNNTIEKNTLTGGAMLFNTKIFKKIKGFDENIFLYYEDNDYFTKCNKLNLKLYLIKNSFHYHKKKDSSSATFKSIEEKYYAKLIAGWHGQWSKFYYIKKYHGFFYSIVKCLPNLIVNIVQFLINLIINYKKAKYIYFKIEGLLSSIIGLPSFKRSKYDR